MSCPALDNATPWAHNFPMSPRNRRMPYRRDLVQKARELRKHSTMGEVLLWRAIKGKRLGCEFHRQVPVGEYIVDFFCHEKMLAIEIDGSTHDHEEQFEYDQKRQAWLEGNGICVVRYTKNEVRQNVDGVAEGLQELVDAMG